jgi:uncharacterized membrane-anchored protein
MTLFGLANAISPRAAFAIGAIVLAVIAFVGGGAMLVVKKTPWSGASAWAS